MRLLVFTDLDGTLLEHSSYDWSPALPALQALEKRCCPVVFCSSKTAAEIIPLRESCENHWPFVVENGGAAYLPERLFPGEGRPHRSLTGYRILKWGSPYDLLLRFFRRFCRRHHFAAIAGPDFSPGLLSQRTGLPQAEARLSLEREFDLLFVPGRPFDLKLLEQEAAAAGYRVFRGGRLFHLLGKTDKGRAVRALTRLFRQHQPGPWRTVGLGDSCNDLPLLRQVQTPVVIPNPASAASLTGSLEKALVAPRPGPAGWNAVMLELLSSLDDGSPPGAL